MDQRQREFVGSMATEFADLILATELAEYLQLSKLVTKERIEDIMTRTDSNFCRNLRLFDAVQESNAARAFDDFVKILERLDPANAPRLITSNHDTKSRKPEGARSLLGKFMDKFAKSPAGKYPLGMKSGSLSSSMLTSPSYHSTSAASSYQSSGGQPATIISSPLKEKHQATLISGSSSFEQQQSPSGGQQQQSPPQRAQSKTDSGFRLAQRYPDGQLPVVSTPPPPPQTLPTTSNGSVNSRLTGQTGDRRHVNKFCQTPTRPTGLTSIHNLSLADDDDHEVELYRDEDSRSGAASDAEEPVICWHPYALSPSSEAGSRAGSPHRCLPSYSSASSESGESSSDSLIVDPNLILDSNVMTAIAREGPHMMTVKAATVCHNNPEEDYKMTANPRGKCLIVNNINFEGEIFPTRKGSDEDANRFDHIFKQLGFDTIMTRNLTADQMRDKFRELAAACRPEHDALFVFLLSHGSEHGIYGTDGLEVYLESEIISCFDNRNCKNMIGKPKVFVIQACRGRSKDCGGEGDTTDSIAWAPAATSDGFTASQENRVPASWLPSNHPSDGKRRKHPIRTDMLLVYSCLAGFVSVRNETAGSWLGVALAYFIMTHAHERDLMRILNLVTSDIIQRESSNGHIQSIELKLLGWTKNLYFNPHIYSTP